MVSNELDIHRMQRFDVTYNTRWVKAIPFVNVVRFNSVRRVKLLKVAGLSVFDFTTDHNSDHSQVSVVTVSQRMQTLALVTTASFLILSRSLHAVNIYISWCLTICSHDRIEDRGSTVVKPLCYKSEGRWFDPSWCQWIFHWHRILPITLWPWGPLSL